MQIYDEIYIGSSPCMMMEAHLSSLNGNKVCIIEKSPYIGGAWHSKDILNFSSVEIGPHFFQSENDILFFKQIYDFLLEKKEKPIWIINYKEILIKTNDKIAKILLQLKYIYGKIFNKKEYSKNEKEDRYFTLLSSMQEILHLIFFKRTSTYYFKNGCASFVNSVYKCCLESGVHFVRDSLLSINKDKEINLYLKSGEVIKTDKIFLTRRSVFESITIKKNTQKMSVLQNSRKQVHFILESSQPLDFFMMRFIGLPFFALTKLLNKSNTYPYKYLFTLTFDNFATQPDHLCTSNYLQILIDKKIFSQDSKVIEQHYSVYSDNRLEDSNYSFLDSLASDGIFLIGDIDFSIWIDRLKRKWSKYKLSSVTKVSITHEPE